MINNTCGGKDLLQSLDRFVLLFPFHLCLLCLGGGLADGPTRARVPAPSNYAIKNFQLYPRLVNLATSISIYIKIWGFDNKEAQYSYIQ